MQEEELRRQQQLADCGMMVPTVPLNMLGEYRSVAVSFDCYQVRRFGKEKVGEQLRGMLQVLQGALW